MYGGERCYLTVCYKPQNFGDKSIQVTEVDQVRYASLTMCSFANTPIEIILAV